MSFRERLAAILRKPESILVVQVGNPFIRATLFELRSREKQVRVVWSVARPTSLEDGARLTADLALLLKKFRKLNRARVLVNLDSRVASTVHGAVLLVRQNGKEGIDEIDLDNLLARGIWKMYDRERGRAAERLHIHDLEVLLADVHLKRIKLDGHRVANPLGFPARMIELQLTQTFLARGFFESLKRLIPAGRIVAVEETMPLLGGLLAQAGDVENFLVGEVQTDRTNIFLVKGNSISYVDTFSWGEQQLLKAFMELWSVDETVMRAVLGLYHERRASERFLKKMEEHLAGEFQLFSHGLSAHVPKADSNVIYLHSCFTLPELVWSSRFGSRAAERPKLRPAILDGVRTRLGFSLDYENGVNPHDTSAAEASIWGWLGAAEDERMTRVLKRYRHWLSGGASTTITS